MQKSLCAYAKAMSEIAKQITEDMKTAMKARESEKLTLLRSISAALKNALILIMKKLLLCLVMNYQ